MRILVTGATGFIGYSLVSVLLNGSHEVTCFIRKHSNTRWLNSLGTVKYVTGDLRDPESLAEAVKGCDVVIHLAGVTTAVNRDKYFKINHLGTRSLIDAIARNNTDLQRFVYISSLSAGGPTSLDRPRTESMPDAPMTHYGESKRAAELALMNYKNQVPITIIRPPIVYGPLDNGVLLFFKLIKKGWSVRFTGDDLYLSLIYVEDLAEAIALLATTFVPSGEIFYINDKYQYSASQIQKYIAEALQIDPKTIPVMRSLLYPAVGVSELLVKLRRRPSFFNYQKIKELNQAAWICSAEKLAQQTGFHAKVSLPEGAHRTAEWYTKHGWI